MTSPTPVTQAQENVHTMFGFAGIFIFELQACTGQTDRRTDRQEQL